MQFHKRLLLVAMCMPLLASQSFAETYEIPMMEYGALSDEDKQQIIDALKEHKILKADDTLKYSGQPQIKKIDVPGTGSNTYASHLLVGIVASQLWPMFCKFVVQEVAIVGKNSCTKTPKTEIETCISNANRIADFSLGFCGIDLKRK